MRKIARIVAAVVGLGVTLPLAAMAQMVDGQVTKIDEPAGKITIRHGPIKRFDMDEAMTMVFRVKDPAMLKSVKAGDRIKFEPDKVNGQFTVIKLQKIK